MENWDQPVKAALAAAQKLYPEASKLLLEEVVKEGPDWLITISFSHPSSSPVPGMGGFSFPSKVYKQFRISGDTNEVKAMKIHNVG
ncbi:MAG: hypothetical protein JO151_10495 [Verrucomicrobia bacterium]|nr:hypothetical protein [Verrucomicrobiota bacterium]